MGHQYTPTVAWNTDYTIPDDGDTLDAASVNVGLEALGNRTQYLYQNTIIVPPSTAADYDLAVGTFGSPAAVSVTVDGTWYTVFNLTGFLTGNSGDLLVLSSHFGTRQVNSVAGVVAVDVRMGYNIGGGAVYPAGCYRQIETNAATEQSDWTSFQAFLPLATNVTTGSLWIEMKGTATSIASLSLNQSYSLQVLRFGVTP